MPAFILAPPRQGRALERCAGMREARLFALHPNALLR